MSYQKKCKYFSMEYVGNPGRVPACNRDSVLEVFDCSNCKDNPDNKIPTNADRLRASTDEELATLISYAVRTVPCFFSTNGKCPIDADGDLVGCDNCAYQWLTQEVTDNG